MPTKEMTTVHAIFEDDNSPSLVMTETYLHTQQNQLNDLLVARGHVFLNEVLDALYLPRIRQGQIAGWTKGDKIEFNQTVMSEADRKILITFNLQPDILDSLDRQH